VILLKTIPQSDAELLAAEAAAQPNLPPDIRTVAPTVLAAQFKEWGEPSFRLKQLNDWLWKKNAPSIEDMTDMGKNLREKLAEHYGLYRIQTHQTHVSEDGTVKFIFRLYDGAQVEGVMIPTLDRITACISSQVGCSLNCTFCATGYLPLSRNLLPFEIYDQAAAIAAFAKNELSRTLSNIVYMGMGEPLLNYKNVLNSIDYINSPEGMNFGIKRITVSTSGIAKMIRRLGDEGFRAELAVSLHAGNDNKRSEIMPINDTNNLASLGEALTYFYQKTGTLVTYEYCVFDHFNDSAQDAKELAEFARIIPSKVNLIEYNPVAESPLLRASNNRMHTFKRELERYGVHVTIRKSRGRDIDGACGQLALRQLREGVS
jgi:23S rRNA (adenine2503-C2)-methyltransferase